MDITDSRPEAALIPEAYISKQGNRPGKQHPRLLLVWHWNQRAVFVMGRHAVTFRH